VVHADATESIASVPASSFEPTEDAEVEEIRAEMEATRVEMSQTIDAIQDRLNPDDLKEQAKDIAKDVTEQVTEHVKETLHNATAQAKEAVRDATVGRAERMFDNASDTAWEVRESVIETVKSNPIPAALVGIGLGWLLMNRGEKNRQYRGSARHDGETYRQYGSSAYGYGTRGTYPSYGVRRTYPYTSAPAYSGAIGWRKRSRAAWAGWASESARPPVACKSERVRSSAMSATAPASLRSRRATWPAT